MDFFPVTDGSKPHCHRNVKLLCNFLHFAVIKLPKHWTWLFVVPFLTANDVLHVWGNLNSKFKFCSLNVEYVVLISNMRVVKDAQVKYQHFTFFQWWLLLWLRSFFGLGPIQHLSLPQVQLSTSVSPKSLIDPLQPTLNYPWPCISFKYSHCPTPQETLYTIHHTTYS